MTSTAPKSFLSGPKQAGEASNFPPVLDVCCGTKMMWFNARDPRALFVDKRFERHVIDIGSPGTIGRKDAVVEPDITADFTELPFPDDSFALVVMDPPHLRRLEARGTLTKKYGVLIPGWEDMLRAGFAECFRVLRPEGTLIFKWCETEIPLERVLALTDERPLFGHRSGAKAKTHWVAFIKHAGAVAPSPAAQKTNVRKDDAPPQAVTVAALGGSQPDSVACSAWLEGGATSPTMNGDATSSDSRDTEQLKAPPSNETRSATNPRT